MRLPIGNGRFENAKTPLLVVDNDNLRHEDRVPMKRNDWSRTKRLVLVAIVLVTAAVAYGKSLSGGFVWDDRPLIVENRLVHGFDGLGTLLTSGFWQTDDTQDRFRAFFRPLVSASYAVDHAVWGLRPFGFRLTNLILHAVCCLLVLGLAREEGASAAAALAAAALFAAHPVHVESVAWISGRTDLLCAAFALGAFALHRSDPAAGAFSASRVGSAALFLLALLSKEMAATLPALVALDVVAAPGRLGVRVRAAARAALPYVVVLAVFLLLRQRAITAEAEPLLRLSPSAFATTATFVLARYATLLLVPIGLDAHYPYAPFASPGHAVVLVSFLMLATIAYGVAFAWKRSPRASFAILWILVTLLPVLAFGRFGDVIMADRFLYIPSVGAALLFACGVDALIGVRLSLGRQLGLATAAAIPLVLIPLCIARASLWENDLRLFSRMAETSPDSAMVRSNLGLAWFREGNMERAIAEQREAIRLVPDFALAHNNLAAALELSGRLAEARDEYRRTLELAPRQIAAAINLGSIEVRLGETERGLARIGEAVRSAPRSATALYAYADALDQAGRRQAARPYVERAIDVDPAFANSHYLRAKILYESGDLAGAQTSMRRFLALGSGEGAFAEVARRIIAQSEPPLHVPELPPPPR